MEFTYIFLFLASCVGVLAQTAASVTDGATGITFQAYFDEDTGSNYGVALPKSPDTDFIGRIVAPLTDGVGWAGFDLGSVMTTPILVVTWPNGDKVMSSLRVADGYATPSVYSGDASLETISKGTFVNSTHISYTFLCKSCITGDELSFSSTDTSHVFGWALSSAEVADATDEATTMEYHDLGFGEFSITLAKAEAADYTTWAAMASQSTTGSNTSESAGNGTTPSATSSATANLPTETSSMTYEYIIAGAGAAGIIVAERLAESGASVLLIERGGLSTFSSGNTDVQAWNSSVTAFDVPAYGLNVGGLVSERPFCDDTASLAGCVLGGTTEVNQMLFVRPQDADFDDSWPTGWKASDMDAARSKLYDRNPGTTSPSSDGKRYDFGVYEVVSSWLASNGFSSADAILEPNRKQNIYTYPPMNIQNGLRAGPVKTYLPLAQALSNFKLMLNTMVIRAVRDGSDISGVEVETKNGTREIINVKPGGKVILASGAMSTPRILFRSGIGPAEQIQMVSSGEVQVELPDQSDWISLPVGVGIKDHVTVSFELDSAVPFDGADQDALTEPSSADVDLFAKGSGILAESWQRLNFWTTHNGTDGVTRYVQGTCYNIANDTISIKFLLTHGITSSGNLTLNADGSTDLVASDLYLATAGDQEAMSETIDKFLGFAAAKGSNVTYSGTQNGTSMLANKQSAYHFVASAKMGEDDGREGGTAVVDVNTKVYGTCNLFVVDGSMHPDLPTGNTQAIIMVAAEAAAAKILALDTSSCGGGSASNSTATTRTSAGPTSASRPSTTFSTAVVAGVGSAISAILPLSTALPSELLTSALPTAVPTASNDGEGGAASMPSKPLPQGTTLKQLLEWLAYVLGAWQGHE